jgi:hypothetical protein
MSSLKIIRRKDKKPPNTRKNNIAFSKAGTWCKCGYWQDKHLVVGKRLDGTFNRKKCTVAGCRCKMWTPRLTLSQRITEGERLYWQNELNESRLSPKEP